MRIVVAVDWTDQSFSAVKEVVDIYSPEELTLAHAVDVGILGYPALAPAMADTVHREMCKAMIDAGNQLLDRTTGLIPPSIPSVRRVCKVGKPEAIILEAVHSVPADLVVTGARGRGRVAELILGSISHRVLSKAPCPTLIVKGEFKHVERILIAVEGKEDAQRIQEWLLVHPFGRCMEVSVISVTPAPFLTDPEAVASYAIWGENARKSAEQLAVTVAENLDGPHYTATGRVLQGDPVEVILHEAATHDLVIVGSHSRTGLDRVLLGSVSHAILHGSERPVLIIR